jgi:hypothetical protein
MKTTMKRVVVSLTCWGWLPPSVAYWVLRLGRLSDA